MTKPSREAFNVLVPPPVQAEIDKLAGKRAGYGDARASLKPTLAIRSCRRTG